MSVGILKDNRDSCPFHSVLHQVKVKMRNAAVAAAAHSANAGFFINRISRFYFNASLLQVSVQRILPIWVGDQDMIAVNAFMFAELRFDFIKIGIFVAVLQSVKTFHNHSFAGGIYPLVPEKSE